MTRTGAFAMMGAMLVGAHAGAGMFTVNLEPDAAKRRAVPISYGTCSAELYLYAPEGWMIGHSSIVAQDSTLWTGPSEYSVRTHLYRMLNANSSREYLVVYGNLTKGEGTDGRSPWFRATVPTVDIDWEGFTSVPDEENEDDRCLFCPVTSDNAKRRRMVIQNPRDDTSLKDPILTLVYSMSALTVRRADGTAVASGTALDTRLSINHTPLTLYADPVAGKDGFRIMLKGPSDGTYEPMDFIWGNSIAADLDVDANRNGVINEADDDTEESVGGTVGVGGALQPLNLKLLPEDLASGTLTLSAESGGARIRIWPNSSTNGTPVALPKNWTVGADTVPDTLYVQGVAASDNPRDVALKLSYTDGQKTVEDAVRLTVVQTDLDVDADYNGAITEADEPLEESAGGLVAAGGNLCPVSLKLRPESLALGTLTLSAEPGGEKIRVWPTASTNGTPVTLPKTWTVGADTVPDTLYVQGLSASGTPRDVKLRLLYKSGALDVCDDNIRLTVFKIDMITPAGDPVNSPVDSGDGQNEFTYSSASQGVLTMSLKACVTPSGTADSIKGLVRFAVAGIGASVLAWDGANPDGKPTASGGNLLATVTFMGLPANNSDFGSKKASVRLNDIKLGEEKYEVFYPRNAANHPDGQSGSPNWFHYWSQAISANNITYSPGSSLYGECPGMLHWSYSTSQNKDVVVVYDTAATEDPGDANADHGKRATTGIDTFEDTYLHEHHHAVQIVRLTMLLVLSPVLLGGMAGLGINQIIIIGLRVRMASRVLQEPMMTPTG